MPTETHRYTREQPEPEEDKSSYVDGGCDQTLVSPPKKSDVFVKDCPLGWLLTIVVPAVIYFSFTHGGNSQNVSMGMYTAIISVPLVMWMFSLTAAFVAPLFAILLLLLFDLAPSSVVLSGFSSNSFLLTFSVLGLGAVILSTGLTYRYTLWVIKFLPANTFWYQAALFFIGIVFTPIVPSIPGRTSILAPVLGIMTKDLDEKAKAKSLPMLYSGGLDGVTFLSAAFLTGAPANLFIFGLLPPQAQERFHFIHWLAAASVCGGIMLVMYAGLSAIYFRAYQKIDISKHRIDEELRRLGPMSWKEWVALFCIFLFAVGVFSTSLHKIKIPLIAFTVLFALLLIGILTSDDFNTKIDWTFLFLLGSVIGVIQTMKYLDIDQVLVNNLAWLGRYMSNDFEIFILLLCAMIVIVRFFFPMATTNFIFATALLPLADASGVNLWLIGFIILIISETSIFNYQSPHIALFRNKSDIALNFNENSISLFRAMLLILKIIAIYASIPFWKSMGIL